MKNAICTLLVLNMIGTNQTTAQTTVEIQVVDKYEKQLLDSVCIDLMQGKYNIATYYSDSLAHFRFDLPTNGKYRIWVDRAGYTLQCKDVNAKGFKKSDAHVFRLKFYLNPPFPKTKEWLEMHKPGWHF